MLSEKGNAFVRPLVNKGFKEERVTTMRLDNLGKSTPLESNKSLSDNEMTALLGLNDNVLELNDHSLITSLCARTMRE
jgi:hypothetical protein